MQELKYKLKRDKTILMNSLYKIRRLLIAALLIFSLGRATAYSQPDDCAVKLKEAQACFDRGQVELVSDLVNPCIQSGSFTREDEIIAYKLLIQALLLDENNASAETFMLEFLRKNPEYEHTAADFSGFVYIKNKFEVKPVIMLSAQVGLNYMFMTGQSERSVSSLPPDISISREPINLYAGAEVLYPLTPRLKVAGGLFFSKSSFVSTENMLNFATSEYQENMSRFEIPVSAIFDIKRFGAVTLFGRLGGGYALNLKTDAKALTAPTDVNNAINRTGENVDRSSSRIGSDFFIQAGLGGLVKIPHGYFTAEVKTALGIRNQVIGSHPGSLEYYYFYTDNIFKMNMIGFSLGYIHIFYKPSKSKD